MAYKVVITPEAAEDLEKAFLYYVDHVSNRVAKGFANDLKSTLLDIQKTLFFQIFHQNYRIKSLKKYPYIIFYTLDEVNKLILIKAIFHTSQNPKKYPE
ncbi:type II toxin-antitoxin system RelE/ParE family toxin [Chryseobacterium potabilaquae]|uniref:Plasmid stabilization system protein ParE n=1 Tax=Chryseobacterium potabilaquae TaxID=2675057 RepID=A0A6N4X9L7_9FLAO|nr:type II toxin-antitoxin system RelE/ParE family toxin [Chryseobacterium potabilaquae]CAA7196984.1 hypothetical protein CHRY9293_03042 [Chryseobacterium potabilaquae]